MRLKRNVFNHSPLQRSLTLKERIIFLFKKMIVKGNDEDGYLYVKFHNGSMYVFKYTDGKKPLICGHTTSNYIGC